MENNNIIPITPETRVHLLENNMKNTLWFANKTDQYNYFYSTRKKTNIDFTYQRKDKTMTVPYLVDDIYNCNYVMYQNHNFNDKWFYAFITNMEYVDEETSRLYITTDPIQTWLFDYTFKESFVEREHTNNDTIGHNTIPENLELGDYIVNSDNKFLGLSLYKYVLGTTIDPNSLTPTNPSAKVYGGVYDGIASGISYYAYDDPSELKTAIENVAKVDEGLQCVFIAPTALLEIGGMHDVIEDDEPQQIGEILELTPLSTLNEYSPRNRKLFCYPYNFIKITNNQGQEGILKPELYTKNSNGKYELKIMGCLTPGCSIRMIPLNYAGKSVALENGINLGKYPVCNWSTDPYINWLTQNGVTNTAGQIGGEIATMLGVASLGSNPLTALGMIGGGVLSVFNSLHQRHLAEIQPPQATGNTNCGDVMTAMGENTFHTMKITIKQEFARIIDKYFDMYGYATNLVKTPLYNHRRNYWYTKTIDANIVGDIPENDMERIKRCFNEGITFWKNPNNMYDYSVNNDII